MTFYRISKLKGKATTGSMTDPVRGTLDVVLKQDGEDSLACVYNELVALRLGQRLGLSLAMGVPSVGDGGTYFASLVVGGLSINLPNITAKQMPKVAERYPLESAGIFVFDVWVLNNDRADNLKANLTESPIHVFAGIDHEQTLLGTQAEMQQSLDALQSLAIPRPHPLMKYVKQNHVDYWVNEITQLSNDAIESAAVFGFSIGAVHDRMQKKLASALKARRDDIANLVLQSCS